MDKNSPVVDPSNADKQAYVRIPLKTNLGLNFFYYYQTRSGNNSVSILPPTAHQIVLVLLIRMQIQKIVGSTLVKVSFILSETFYHTIDLVGGSLNITITLFLRRTVDKSLIFVFQIQKFRQYQLFDYLLCLIQTPHIHSKTFFIHTLYPCCTSRRKVTK